MEAGRGGGEEGGCQELTFSERGMKHQVSRGMSSSPLPAPRSPTAPQPTSNRTLPSFLAFDVDIFPVPQSQRSQRSVCDRVGERTRAGSPTVPLHEKALWGGRDPLSRFLEMTGISFYRPYEFQNGTPASRHSGDAFFAVTEACSPHPAHNSDHGGNTFSVTRPEMCYSSDAH